jgi:hypothetical protein
MMYGTFTSHKTTKRSHRQMIPLRDRDAFSIGVQARNAHRSIAHHCLHFVTAGLPFIT